MNIIRDDESYGGFTLGDVVESVGLTTKYYGVIERFTKCGTPCKGCLTNGYGFDLRYGTVDNRTVNLPERCASTVRDSWHWRVVG